MIERAVRLEMVAAAFRGQPLYGDDLTTLRAETAAARGENSVVRIKNYLSDCRENQKLLFCGFRGCGKSTELNFLARELEREGKFFVLPISVWDELDISKLEFLDILLLLIERLFEMADIRGSAPDRTRFELTVERILAESALFRVEEKGSSHRADLRVSGKVWPFLAELRKESKLSSTYRQEVRLKLEPRLGQLIDICNDFIRSVLLVNPENSESRRLCIIIEDLDKLPRERALSLFLNYSEHIRALDTFLILTLHPSVWFSHRFNELKSGYDKKFQLPMIKVRSKEGNVDVKGMDVLWDMVKRRMDVESLFEEPKSSLDRMIVQSGGVIRDLFNLIVDASMSARAESRSRISLADIEQAINNLRQDYGRNIAEFNDESGRRITPKEMYDTLVALEKDPARQAENTEVTNALRQSLCILEYNGEGWSAVHPLVHDILINKGVL
jgi:DNA polymerase III delta prime subunit